MIAELERLLGRDLTPEEKRQIRDYVSEFRSFRGSDPSSDDVLYAVFDLQRDIRSGKVKPVAIEEGYGARERAKELRRLNYQEGQEIDRLRQRGDIAPRLTAAEEQATAEELEAQLGVTFLRDESGNVVVHNGAYVTEQVDPQTGFYIGVDPETGGMGPVLGYEVPEEDEPDPFIGGFPEDYRVPDLRFEGEEDLIARLDPQARLSIEQAIGRDGEPRYRQWSQWTNFSTKSSEYQTQVQQELVAAGLLDEKDVVKGVWTFAAARAMEEAMAISNSGGGALSWVDVLGKLKRGQIEEGDDDAGGRGPLAGRRLSIPAYREPDYATLSQSVKSLFRNQLGRDPLDWEVALLSDQLNQDYRSQYDAEAGALRSEFEAGNRAILQSEGSEDPIITSGGTVQAVDPVARLRERFETKYGGELELNDDRVEERQQLGNVFSILTQASNLMGGGVR